MQAPTSTEWYYIWNQQVRLQQVVADLEAAKGPGNNAAGINARLIQIVQGWGNNPPQWANIGAYQGIWQYINQNRALIWIETPWVTINGNPAQRTVIKFVNELAAYFFCGLYRHCPMCAGIGGIRKTRY